MKRRHLLVVNRGPSGWPTAEPSDRTWDHVEMVWHPQAKASGDMIVGVPADKRKFAAFAWLAGTVPSLLDHDVVCLVDDDVLPAKGTSWNVIIERFIESGAHVGMPALTPQSVYAHAITRQDDDPSTRWRETNYMDIMAVLFTRDGLRDHLDSFDTPGDQWGLELVWSHREAKAGRNLVILDSTPVDHLRPIGGGRDVAQAERDCNALLAKHGIGRVEHQTLKVHR